MQTTAGYSRQAERELERIRGTFTDPISTEILHTVKAGRRGRLRGDGWSATTVRNNPRRFRILHTALRDRNGLSNRLFGLSINEINDLIDELAVKRDWSANYERNFAMAARKVERKLTLCIRIPVTTPMVS